MGSTGTQAVEVVWPKESGFRTKSVTRTSEICAGLDSFAWDLAISYICGGPASQLLQAPCDYFTAWYAGQMGLDELAMDQAIGVIALSAKTTAGKCRVPACVVRF